MVRVRVNEKGLPISNYASNYALQPVTESLTMTCMYKLSAGVSKV